MTPKGSKKPYAEYTGNGEYLTGIPARDLTEAEWGALREIDRAFALDSGLYIIHAAQETPGDSDKLEG